MIRGEDRRGRTAIFKGHKQAESNDQTGINYRTQRFASCQSSCRVIEDWPQLQFCKQGNSGSTAVVTMSPDTAGTAMLEEERSYIDSGTSPIKKKKTNSNQTMSHEVSVWYLGRTTMPTNHSFFASHLRLQKENRIGQAAAEPKEKEADT